MQETGWWAATTGAGPVGLDAVLVDHPFEGGAVAEAVGEGGVVGFDEAVGGFEVERGLWLGSRLVW